MKLEVKEFDPKGLSGFVWTTTGHRVADIGDDGQVLILGHHDDAAALAIYAENQRYLIGEDLSADDLKVYDVIRGWVLFTDHSESCEATTCTCEETVCAACLEGLHGCTDDTCECFAGFEHKIPESGICGCECYCDEYAWWALNMKPGHGHPVTFIRYSWQKARELRFAA